MSRLDELIEKLCPNGVEYKSLWEVTIWDKKFNSVDKSKQPKVINYPYLLANKLFALQQEDGDVFLLSTGEKTGWTTMELAGDNMCEGEVVTIPWGKSRAVVDCIKYYKGKFVTADNRIATSNNTNILSNKYLYYWMMKKGDIIDSYYRGSGIKHPSMKDVLDMKIPIPPLEVQEEIVRILDEYSEKTNELIENLTAELTARKKQYEYYTQELLKFDSSIKTFQLRELINFRNGKGHEKDINNDGKYIVVNSKFISTNGEVKKYSNIQICPLYIDDILMVMSDLPNGKALAKCYVVDENDKYTLNQRIGAFHVKDETFVNTRFLYYILNRNAQLLRFDNGADQTNLRKDDILNIIIPVPSIEEQQRIVDILDRFETLCNDISTGLPAEIEARQKQYENYRDKLLTFKEMS